MPMTNSNPSLSRSDTQTLTSSPVRSESRRLKWHEVESKIQKLARAAVDELTKDEARRLYRLKLSASMHTGRSPRFLLEQAKALLRS